MSDDHRLTKKQRKAERNNRRKRQNKRTPRQGTYGVKGDERKQRNNGEKDG